MEDVHKRNSLNIPLQLSYHMERKSLFTYSAHDWIIEANLHTNYCVNILKWIYQIYMDIKECILVFFVSIYSRQNEGCWISIIFNMCRYSGYKNKDIFYNRTEIHIFYVFSCIFEVLPKHSCSFGPLSNLSRLVISPPSYLLHHLPAPLHLGTLAGALDLQQQLCTCWS